MATLPPGRQVALRPEIARQLAFPPLETAGPLVIAVHPGAMNAPQSTLTLAVQLDGDAITWAGALDEAHLQALPRLGISPRPALAQRLLTGDHLWEVLLPGSLLAPGVHGPLGTVYDDRGAGTRPWIVVGALANGLVLAVPLNDPSNPKPYTPVIRRIDLGFDAAKDGQVELPHLWSLPVTPAIGRVGGRGRQLLEPSLHTYFALPPAV